MVIVDTNNILIFNSHLINTRFGTKHTQNGFVLFDHNNNFMGHLEANSQNGFNEFNATNSWIKFVI